MESIGIPELFFFFVVALWLFGPWRRARRIWMATMLQRPLPPDPSAHRAWAKVPWTIPCVFVGFVGYLLMGHWGVEAPWGFVGLLLFVAGFFGLVWL